MGNRLNCPKCKQIDKVQKVSALFYGGISTAQREVWVHPPPKTDWAPLRTTREEVSQTILSKKLTPPTEPSKKDFKPEKIAAAEAATAGKGASPVVVLIIITLSVLSIAALVVENKGPVLVLLGIIVLVTLIIGTVQKSQYTDKAQAAYDKAI